MSAKKENPDNYIGRTEEGIRKLKERERAKIGNPKHLETRRLLHRKDPRIRLRGGARERAIEKGIDFKLRSYKDLPKVPKNCPILDIALYVGNKVSTEAQSSRARAEAKKELALLESDMKIAEKMNEEAKDELQR